MPLLPTRDVNSLLSQHDLSLGLGNCIKVFHKSRQCMLEANYGSPLEIWHLGFNCIHLQVIFRCQKVIKSAFLLFCKFVSEIQPLSVKSDWGTKIFLEIILQFRQQWTKLFVFVSRSNVWTVKWFFSHLLKNNCKQVEICSWEYIFP